MRILSWNLLKARGAVGGDIRRLVDAHRPDLLLMQEATGQIDTLPELLGGSYVRKAMQQRNHGPAAWSPVPFESIAVPLPLASRLDLPVAVLRLVQPRIALIVRLGGIEFATVHLDHGQFANRRQLRHLLDSRPGLGVVIGDFNALGPTRLPGFTDAGPRRTTHLAYGVVPLRLDRCLVRGLRATRAQALAYGASDHRPILIDLVPATG